jgi:hypothetical protein
VFNGRLTHTNYRQVSTEQQKYQRENSPFLRQSAMLLPATTHTQRVCFPRTAAGTQLGFLAVLK